MSAASHETKRAAALIVAAARKARGRPYAVEIDGFVIVGNDRLAAAFDADTLELAALVDTARQGRLLATGGGPIWKVSLATITSDPIPPEKPYIPNTIQTDAGSAAKRAGSVEQSDRAATVTLEWSGVSTAEEKGIISARARITARQGSPYLHWRIGVDCGSAKRGLWEVFFPRVESVLPMGPAEQTVLFVPSDTGRAVRKPFAVAKTYKNRYPTHPRTACMQFSALYGPAGGLYLATHDGKASIKEFIHECRSKPAALGYSLRNLPPDRGDVGMSYKMPYDLVMTTFEGDWFDACQLYRPWAIRQKWCSKGPLHSRKDVPKWYKELGYWMLAWEQKAIMSYETMIKPKIGDGDQPMDDIRSIARQVDVPLAVHFYGWHSNRFDTNLPEHLPPLLGKARFREQVQELHAAGVRIVPYICGSLWDNSSPSYKQQNAVRYSAKKPNGQPLIWRFFHQAHFKKGWVDKPICDQDWMCPTTDFWQNKIKDISVELVRDYDVDGVYYDVVIGTCHECFDPSHGHPKGGGDYWVSGTRELLLKNRKAIKAIKPDVMMTSEEPSEPYIDCLDSMLLSLNQGKSGNVPAFQAVYHDYCLLFGNMAVHTQGTLSSLPMAIGESLVSGDQLGWFNTWVLFRPNHPREELKIYWADEALRKKYLNFTIHVARLRYRAGQKFLVFGQMLRPLTFKNQLPIREGFWQWDGKQKRRFPAVMNSVWKAPDGSVGVVLCNITDREHAVEFTLDLKQYGMPAGRKLVVVRREIDGSETRLRSLLGRSTSLKLTVPALTAMILEARSEPPG